LSAATTSGGRARLAAKLATQPPGYRFPLGRVLAIYSALTLVVFLSALDQAIVATAGVGIVADIGGVSGYAWIFTGYILASTVTIPLWGKLADVLGKKRPLVASVSLFLIGSTLCALATSMPELVAFRVIQGLGAGGLVPLSHATIGSIVPIRERGRFLGLIIGAFALGSVGGPLVGGLLVDTLGWRSIFLVNIPFGVFALLIIHLSMAVPAETGTLSDIDWVGASLLAATASLVLFVLSTGGETASWTAPATIVALCLAVPLATALVFQERRVPSPILPFGLFRRGTVTASVFCISTSGAIMFLVIAELPFYVQSVSRSSATAAGVTLIPMLLGMSVAAFTTGQISVRWGRGRPMAIVGTFLAVIGLVLLAHLPDDATFWEAARGSVLVGLGIGGANQVFLVSVQNAVSRSDIGAATALSHFGRMIGGVLGVTLVGIVIARALPDGTQFARHGLNGAHVVDALRSDLAGALRLAFWIAAGVELVAFFVVVFLLDELTWHPISPQGPDGYAIGTVTEEPPNSPQPAQNAPHH
jgi:EmrB/QacA subfamily drug resistance transporter